MTPRSLQVGSVATEAMISPIDTTDREVKLVAGGGAGLQCHFVVQLQLVSWEQRVSTAV